VDAEHYELLQRTRQKAYVTLIKLCEDPNVTPETKLQVVAMLLAATERDIWLATQEEEEGEPSDEEVEMDGRLSAVRGYGTGYVPESQVDRTVADDD